MAHFALIENGTVQRVVVVANDVLQDANGDEQESLGIDFCRSLFDADGDWKQTSYNGNVRKNFATVGCQYDSTRDAFIGESPYASWVFNETTCRWDAPVPYPTDGRLYDWDEETTSWVADEPPAEDAN